MFRLTVLQKIEQELNRGETARRQGLEGQARVCARRAAGAAVREYLELRGLEAPGPSAVDLLNSLAALPDVSDRVKEVVEHLLTRVNEAYELPVEVDLLADSRWLAEELQASLPRN